MLRHATYLLLIVWLVLPVAAHSQSAVQLPKVEREVSPKSAPDAPAVNRSVTGPAGRDIRIGAFVSLRADCTAGALPTIRLQGEPKHGKVTVRQGKARATNHQKCLAVEVPAFIVLYRSKPDFEGDDEVGLEVVIGNKRQIHKITVTVTGGKGIQRI